MISEDGYILTLHRIYNKKLKTSIENLGQPEPAVLLQHGIENSASQWVLNSPKKAPAFILANKNFDVWLASSRGSKYSKKHLRYSSDSK